MSNMSHTIVNMAELWDKLTPSQQRMMIHRAEYLVSCNSINNSTVSEHINERTEDQEEFEMCDPNLLDTLPVL